MSQKNWKRKLCGLMAAIFLVSEMGSTAVYAAGADAAVTEMAEEIQEETEETEETEATEDTEVTENTEDTEVTENTEDTEATEETEETEATEDTEVTENTEDTEVTENTEDTEATEVTEETEATEETEMTEATEDTENVAEEIRFGSVTGGTTKDNALEVALNETHTASLSSVTRQGEYYKFTLSKAGLVTLSVSNDKASDANLTAYFDYESKNNSLVTLVSKAVKAGETGNTNQIGLEAGTYYIYMEKASLTSSVSYQFTIGYTQTDNCEKEPNDSFGAATTVPLNTTINGSGYKKNDEDFYKFTLEKAGVVSIDFSHGVISGSETKNIYTGTFYFTDNYLDILKDGLSYSFTSQGAQQSLTSAQIGLKAGTYYFKVKTEAEVSDNYNFQIHFAETANWETEKNDSYSAANAVTIGNTYSGSIYSASDVDYYEVVTTEDGALSLDFNHENVSGRENTPVWKVLFYSYSETTKTTTEIFSQIISGGTTATVTPQVGVPAGKYYVAVAAAGTVYDTTTYQIKVNHAAGACWEKESNDTFSTANEAELEKTYSGSIHKSTDKDYYKVTLSADGALKVNFSHPSVAGRESNYVWKVSLYRDSDRSNAVYTQSIYGGDVDTALPQMGLKAGVYYVCVESAAISDTSTYQISTSFTKSAYWEMEPNDSTTTATEIKNLDKTYSGSIHKLADVDYYKVTLEGAGGLGLTFSHDIVSGSEASSLWKVSIYEASNLRTAIYSQTISGGDKKTVTPQIGLKAGTYYIAVASANSLSFCSDTYKLKCNYSKSNYWEIEGNDTFDTATSIKSGKTYHGSMKEAKDYDYYKIKMKKKGYLQLNIRQSSEKSGKIYRVKVYNADKQELFSTEVPGTDSDFSTCKLGLGKGTYYIRLETYISNLYTGTYKLTATATAASDWESEANDDLTSADKMTVGKTINGACDANYAEDYDYYTFTMDKKAYVTVSLTHKNLNGSNTAWSVYLYDSKGNKVDRKNSYLSVKQDGTYAETNKIKLPKGTYYIRVNATEYGTGEEYGLTVNKISAKKPVIKSVKSTEYNKIKVTWNAVAGAEKYMIYRSTSKDGSYSKVKTITNVSTTSWTDKDVKTGKTYYYKMKAVVTTDKSVTSGYSAVKSAKCVPAKPGSVKVSSPKKKQLKVSWKKVSGASGYEVYRATSKDGKYKKVKTIGKGKTVTYTDKKVSSGKTYYYKVRSYRTVNGEKVYSGYSSIVSKKAK